MKSIILVNAIVWVCLALVLAIVFNLFGIARGSEYGKPIPVTYVHRVHTVHFRCLAECNKPYSAINFTLPAPVPFQEFKEWTGLRDFPKQQTIPVLVKEIDPNMVMTASLMCAFMAVVGFVTGYGARKTN